MFGVMATGMEMKATTTKKTSVSNKENTLHQLNGTNVSTHSFPLLKDRADQLLADDDHPRTAPPSKPISLLTTLLRECLCTDAFRPPTGKNMGEAFIKLEGIECISLGAVEAEHSARSRVMETVRLFSTRTKRLVNLGYILDADAQKSSDQIVSSGFPRFTQSIPLEVYENNYPDDVEQSLSKLQWSALQHIQDKDYEEALCVFDTILEEQRANPRQRDNIFLAGITVHNMGVVQLLAGNSDEALSLFQQAIRMKETSFGPSHPEVADSLDELGIQHFAREEFEEALKKFHMSQKLRMNAFGPQHPKVAMVMNNIACVHFQTRNSVLSLTKFEAAHEIQRNAMGTSAKADLDLLHVATTLSNMAYMKFRLKNYEEARAVFEEALLIQQSVLGDNDKAIQDTLSNVDIANAFHS